MKMNQRMTIELSSLQVIALDQNVPNPFAEQTSIGYFIPEEAGAAKIMFFDLTGRILKTVEVQKGYGIMTVFAPSLSTGTYSYSLLIDGKAVETKKMVKHRKIVSDPMLSDVYPCRIHPLLLPTRPSYSCFTFIAVCSMLNRVFIRSFAFLPSCSRKSGFS